MLFSVGAPQIFESVCRQKLLTLVSDACVDKLSIVWYECGSADLCAPYSSTPAGRSLYSSHMLLALQLCRYQPVVVAQKQTQYRCLVSLHFHSAFPLQSSKHGDNRQLTTEIQGAFPGYTISVQVVYPVCTCLGAISATVSPSVPSCSC